ncbi:TauD/TfdA family dioxygenase [Marinomonas sp. C2222]|uniref:TauD/TfdA family dioxygenase n=1 Tax=Marinomonas sargassi TaxID=2984494 RepID=A0ABT2YSI3_9GAMM|nr:TauD/TfdA family dioxygenase [Marinomonas sargassi]MCV2402599.1 TauD/TfdA family dioxygenase [Marinomonas sargassi]
MNILPLSNSIGALVENIDLSTITEGDFHFLYAAFLQHKVLFLRDQSMTPAEHLALGKRFGSLEPVHPFFPHVEDNDQVIIIETSLGNPPGESFWHTDMTWKDVPPKCSILHAQYVPEEGGDTIWCNMAAVWKSLPEDEKAYLRTLKVSHELHAFKGSRYDKEESGGQSYADKVAQQYEPIVRSMVQVHPETQEEVLYINEQYVHSVIGLSPLESDALLSRLFAKAREEQFQIRFSWQANSVAIWDNRITQHYAVTDYGDAARRLHRVTVSG